MNQGRFVLTVLVVFAVIYGYDYLIHGVLMMDQYAATAKLWRMDGNAPIYLLVMAASHLLYALMFVFIFARNYENLGIGEGLRFGLYIGLLLASLRLATYAYLPVPLIIVIWWMATEVVKSILIGAVSAAVYRQ